MGIFLVALATTLAITVLGLASTSPDPVKLGADGWYRLRPKVSFYIVMLVMLLAAIGFGALSVGAAIQLSSETGGNRAALWGGLFIGPPIALLGWFCAYRTLIVRVSFNETGIRYRTLLIDEFVSWREMIRLKDDAFWGTYIKSNKRRFYISKYHMGFPQLYELLRQNNVPVDEIDYNIYID